MTDIYLFGLFTVLLTEYGFQSRARALERFKVRWLWRRTALRLMLWLGYAVLLLGRGTPATLAVLVGAVASALTEIVTYLHRRSLRASLSQGSPHGSLRGHLAPVGLSLLMPAGVFIVVSLLAGPGSGLAPRLSPSPFLAIGTAVVALWCWGTFVTVAVIDLVRPEVLQEEDETALWGPGEVIGILERLIAFVLILAGSPAAVGLVLAAKSAARFPEFKKAAFAEYFLVGTLTSLGLAVAGGVIVTHLVL